MFTVSSAIDPKTTTTTPEFILPSPIFAITGVSECELAYFFDFLELRTSICLLTLRAVALPTHDTFV